MKLFSFRTIRRLTTHKATKEFVETTEFRDGAEKRKGKTGVNWFIDWSVTWRISFISFLVHTSFSSDSALTRECWFYSWTIVIENVQLYVKYFLAKIWQLANWYNFLRILFHRSRNEIERCILQRNWPPCKIMCKWIEINSYILYYHYINNKYEFFVIYFIRAVLLILLFQLWLLKVEKTLNEISRKNIILN